MPSLGHEAYKKKGAHHIDKTNLKVSGVSRFVEGASMTMVPEPFTVIGLVVLLLIGGGPTYGASIAGCSRKDAETAARQFAPPHFATPLVREVLCDDFHRYGVMVFLTSQWHAVTPRRPPTLYGKEWFIWDEADFYGVKPEQGAVKILPDGDLLGDTGLGYSVTLRWDRSHFKSVAISPSPDTRSCSLLAARQLVTLQTEDNGSLASALTDVDIYCAAFDRHRVMIFLSGAGSDERAYSVYRATNAQWTHIQDFDMLNKGSLEMPSSDELLVESLNDYEDYRWNGSKFVMVKKWQTIVFWDGHRWVEKQLSPTDIRAWGNNVPLEYAEGDFTGERIAQYAFTTPAVNPNFTRAFVVRQTAVGSPQFIFDSEAASDDVHCIRPDRNGGFIAITQTFDPEMARDPACQLPAGRCVYSSSRQWGYGRILMEAGGFPR